MSAVKHLGILLAFSALGGFWFLFSAVQFIVLEYFHAIYMFVFVSGFFVLVFHALSVMDNILKRIRRKGGPFFYNSNVLYNHDTGPCGIELVPGLLLWSDPGGNCGNSLDRIQMAS